MREIDSMSKPYYVKVEIPKEIAEASYEALRQAKQTGKISNISNLRDEVGL